ncbi:MAG: carboxypeptidase-like regulatory domain-containing protein, partial [Marinifilum sp.]|nr:carboxypeptidase-like regulatory domain-containing protein [Marinifilum sp.]
MKKNDYWRIPIRFGIRKKWLLAMKISLILLLAFNFSLSASVLSQTRVALNLKNATFFELIQEIESKTDLGFIYNQNDIKNIGVISLDTEDISVEEVLNVALKNSGLDYEIEREIIIIKPAKILPKLEETQQKKTIKGTVTDNDGTPLPGVSVVIKGTITGVATNMDGEYVIEVLRENATLVFSFVGMQAQEIVYAGQQFINVKLEADSEQMEEVVVTGIFNKKKSSYVGSVTTVAEKELKMFGNRNVLSTLKNIDPSFNIMADNVFGSDPNHLPEINMRGSSSLPSLSDLRSDTRGNLNSPLIILDGFEISLQKMIDLNNDEIKSITLLKDASATAIYGSRGANGVVVITTKQPEEGKLKITAKSTINVELA